MMDDFIFDEHDELDTVLFASLNEYSYNALTEEIHESVSVHEDYMEDEAIDCMDIPQDETEVSPIGMDAEMYIDADQELMMGDDEDNELIDIVGGF